jgi:hypothetical protein
MQVGSLPSFTVPATPGSPTAQVTISNFNLSITNPTFVNTPDPANPAVSADMRFTSSVLLSVERNGALEYWGIDGQRIIQTVHFIDDWQGGGSYRRIKAEMYCEDLRFNKYGQAWVFSGIQQTFLRITPTRESSGYVTSTLVGPDQYRISGFFDVFFDVSLDDGASWHSIPTPIRWEVVPAPSTVALMGLSGLLAVRRRRR